MTTVVSFDGTERCDARLVAPDDEAAAREFLETTETISIRGSGLSYANASSSPGGTAMCTRRFDRILGFDDADATVRVQSGATIGAVLRAAVERGFHFPVLPGHPHISVGGCVAFNTHGKTQHDIGQFSDHVVSLTLVHPDHGTIECAAGLNDDVRELTIGGMGLTGWISEVTLRLQPLPGRSLRRRTIPVSDFRHAVATMEALDEPGTHLYSWNDANRRGGAFGRGMIYAEDFVDDAGEADSRYRSLSPEQRGRMVPVPLWNRVTSGLANRIWPVLARLRGDVTLPVLDAAFPINGKEGYFHLFGRRGFREYQLIVPRGAWESTTDRLRDAVRRTGACVTLSSLKLFRGEPRLLWFRGDGICLTIDGPATAATERLFAELDTIAVDLRAPVNLAKDSRLDAAAVRAVFGAEYDHFRDRLVDFDPKRRVRSALRSRIDV